MASWAETLQRTVYTTKEGAAPGHPLCSSMLSVGSDHGTVILDHAVYAENLPGTFERTR